MAGGGAQPELPPAGRGQLRGHTGALSLGEERPDFVGTLDEVERDLERAHDLGVAEIVFTAGYATGELSLHDYLRTLERLRSVF